MTTPTVTEPDTTSPLGVATENYRKAAAKLVEELERRIAERVLAVFPEASDLHTFGEVNEDGLLSVRAVRVTDDAGAIVAGGGPGSEVVEHNDHAWDHLTDELFDDLTSLADLMGDEYLGAALLPIDRVEPTPPSVLLVVDGVATCPRCGGTDFEYHESYPVTRTMDDNEDGVLRFDADFDWSEGNSTPGIVCVNTVGGGVEAARQGVSIRKAFRQCGAELEMPETGLELAWS